MIRKSKIGISDKLSLSTSELITFFKTFKNFRLPEDTSNFRPSTDKSLGWQVIIEHVILENRSQVFLWRTTVRQCWAGVHRWIFHTKNLRIMIFFARVAHTTRYILGGLVLS